MLAVICQLGADPEPRGYYESVIGSPGFQAPRVWAELDVSECDGLLLTGGHAPGMRQYLESEVLGEKIAAFWALKQPVGAICHGTLRAARNQDPSTGKSILAPAGIHGEDGSISSPPGSTVTFYLHVTHVEAEVKAALDDPERQFVGGPFELMGKGTDHDDRHAFVGVDGHYISARW